MTIQEIALALLCLIIGFMFGYMKSTLDKEYRSIKMFEQFMSSMNEKELKKKEKK